jgi:hypothetical protein
MIIMRNLLMLIRQAVFLQFCKQCFIIDLKNPGRLRLVSTVRIEHALDMRPFDLVEGAL